MSRGHKDWRVDSQSIFQVDNDINELVSRMGSPYTLNRTGKVLWMTNFERNVNDLELYTTLGDGSFSLISDETLFGNQALRLNVGSADDGNWFIRKALPFTNIKTMGIQFAIRQIDPQDTILTIGFNVNASGITGANEGNRTIVYANIHLAEFDVYDGNSASADNEIYGGFGALVFGGHNKWVMVKAVIDHVTQSLNYVQINGKIIPGEVVVPSDLSTHLGNITMTLIHSWSLATKVTNLVFDHIIITTDEPLLTP